MRILFISAEVAPFVSVGGLSQVLYFLPRALRQLGHDVRIFTPHYGTMDKVSLKGKSWSLKNETKNLLVPVGEDEKTILCGVSFYSPTTNNPPTYFLENEEYYRMRANVFGYADDHIRFGLLSRGCLEWLKQKHEETLNKKKKESLFIPDIIHCNDWHTGYFMDLARRDPRYQKILAKTSLVYTIHNFSYQGNYDFKYRPANELDDGINPLASLFSPQMQRQNALKRGILYADTINTVSPTHAREVLTSEYSEGLEDVLIEARGKLTGILNGLDTKEFDPSTDPIIKKKFSAKSFTKERGMNKEDLQKEFFLPVNKEIPLLVISGRLTPQKGWDLLLDVLPHLLREEDIQLIVLGSGDDRYRHAVSMLKIRYPEKVGFHLRPDFRLPRKLFAGADMIAMPSVFEPGGIVALEALRYGCVPIVRRTGGLSDIITDFNPEKGIGNGFSFEHRDPWSLYGALIEALTIYKYKTIWNKLIKNCLDCDFSWGKAAKEYEKLYKKSLEVRKRAVSITPHPAYAVKE